MHRIRISVSAIIDEGPNDLDEMEIEGLRAEVREAIDDLPDLQFFENLDLTCNKAIFFEILSSSVKNVTLGHQAWIFKTKNKLKTSLTNSIKNLKQNFINNKIEILALERRLSAISESELRSELLKIKNFERLNNEKITPYFLKIAKSSKPDDSLECLKNNQSQDFLNEDERSNHITEYYEDIYKKPPNDPVTTREDIDNFLEETVNHHL